jgi:hypothetical protein
MAANAELIEFVKEGLRHGVPRSRLDEALRAAGWDRAQVTRAIGQFAEVEFAVPVPKPAPLLDARDAFMYVLMYSTLYFSGHSLCVLLFELTNLAFPDPAAHDYAAMASEAVLRWSISSLIVGLPVFVSVAWQLTREVRADLTKRASKVRRQLTYLTLFIAAIVLIGDVTTLVYNLLGGEMTERFLLKVLTVGVIAGAGFGYYLRQLRQDQAALAS